MIVELQLYSPALQRVCFPLASYHLSFTASQPAQEVKAGESYACMVNVMNVVAMTSHSAQHPPASDTRHWSSQPTTKWSGFRNRTWSFGLGPALHPGGLCVHTLWYSWCVCDPRVVQWTQQTTTVDVLCSCCPTPNGYIL